MTTATLDHPTDRFCDIRTLAELHFEDHGLHDYRLVWDYGTRHKGQCRRSKREIGLSDWFVRGGTEDEIEQTILHEIAHVLSPPVWNPRTRKWVVHGDAWKRQARAIGVRNPRAASATSAPPRQTKYSGTCKRCGDDSFRMARMGKDTIGHTHRGCGGGIAWTTNW